MPQKDWRGDVERKPGEPYPVRWSMASRLGRGKTLPQDYRIEWSNGEVTDGTVMDRTLMLSTARLPEWED